MKKPGYGVTTVGLVFLFGALLTACASSDPARPVAFVVPVPPFSEDEYVIQRRDTLSIRFYNHPDHNQSTVLVRDDGKIMLPLVGDVEAAGLTPPQLSTALTKRYGSNLRDPVISVVLTSLESEMVWVGGEVKTPGFVPYRTGLTAAQALVAVGGPKDTAAPNECFLLQRVSPQEYRSSKIDLAKVLEGGDTTSEPVLGPRDVILVPMSGIAKANLWVKQYITNMLPISLGYKTPRPRSSPDEESTSSPATNRPATGPTNP